VSTTTYPTVSEAEPSEPANWLVAAVGESLVIEQLDGVGNEVYVTSTAVQDNAAIVARTGKDGVSPVRYGRASLPRRGRS
jgi:hypothetical protein